MAASTPSKSPAFDAALREAMALHQSGRFPDAAARYEALVPSAPDDPQLRYLLGAAYVELHRTADAVAALEHALRLRPGHLPVLEMLGSAWLRGQSPEKAVSYFREADRLTGGTAESMDRLANALRLADQHAEASSVFRRLLTRDPSQRRAYVGLAMSLAAAGDVNGAEETLRACLARHAEYAAAYITLASVLGQAERFIQAEAVLRKFLTITPAHLEARRLLANTLHKQGRLAEAEQAYREVLRNAPGDVQAALQLAEALIELSNLAEAESILRDLRRRAPQNANVVTTLGRVFELRGDLQTAIALHSEALAYDPRCQNAYLNRGSAKRFGGDFEGALADYDAALAIKPDFPPAIANRGLTLLILGRLHEAWPHYSSRLRALPGAPDLSAGKKWDGSSLAGKRVLVWLEYGLGDEILFASLLPDLIDQVAHCTVVCSPRLLTLFQRSFPRATVMPFGASVGDDFDVRLALTDAARMLRPSLNSFPSHGGYLIPDLSRVREMRARYAEGAARVIGLSWRSASAPSGRFKSIPLADWVNALELPNATFVSLQYGECADEILQVSQITGRKIIHDAGVDTAGDLDTFAAQVAAMDLVISVSNTTVHVAGALGRPVWAMVPTGPGAHWYWFLDRADNPWYPSLRLFRQQTGGDWAKPLSDVALELATWLRS